MKKLLLTLTSLLLTCVIASAQETTQKDTLATFKVENGDDIVFRQNDKEGVSINVAGYQISLAKGREKEPEQKVAATPENPPRFQVVDRTKRLRYPVCQSYWFTTLRAGFATLPSPDYSMYTSDNSNFLNLTPYKSYSLGMNVLQLTIFLESKRKFIINTGINATYNNYNFSNYTTLGYENQMVTPVALDESYSRSKLMTTYATVPLTLTANLRDVIIDAGVYAGILLDSRTKCKKPKVVESQVKGMNQNVTGMIVAIRFNGVGIYCDYNFTSLFNKDQGPEVNAASAGITFRL